MLEVEKEKIEILQMRVPDKELTEADVIILCVHVLMIIESY